MRPIDADKLFQVVAGHHDLYKGATLRTDKARRDELLQVMVDINNSPTVDAIPVDWILNMVGDEETYTLKYRHAWSTLVCLWNKEHETKEGD